MPLPMVHLGIAVQMGELKGEKPSPEFLLGSISPDAIHMRPNIERQAKAVTHLLMNEDGWEERMQSLLAKGNPSASVEQKFLAGYIAHILTDQLWIETVILPYRKRIPTMLDQAEKRRLYYQETDQIDFNLYNNALWRKEVWGHLREAEAIELEPLLTANEIAMWQDRTLRWFDELKEEPKVESKYLTDQVTGDFMGKAAVHVAQRLDEWCSYHYLEGAP